MKSCPTPLAITEMQIEPTMRYHYTLRRMAEMKKAPVPRVCEGMGTVGPPRATGRRSRRRGPFGKAVETCFLAS